MMVDGLGWMVEREELDGLDGGKPAKGERNDARKDKKRVRTCLMSRLILYV